MRFIENGPSIPDELLTARDEGRVVFFCGAGVSRARAGLSDFFGLAGDVITKLRVSIENPAVALLNEAKEISKRTGVDGIISADRVFGILEREFAENDINRAVANALKPPKNVNLTAHKLILDLARTPDGRVRLVTTNFDRLFSDCEPSLNVMQPPRLPDPSRPHDMDGIIHIHGRATENYDDAEGDGFVLSSSAFGSAYLADGWATRFFQNILNKYVVVFIGYTADDPPVHYLLEALNRKPGQLSNVYAFQSGSANDAAARWSNRGITAIPYDAADNHSALWNSLDAWASRARSPDNWYKSVLAMAYKGPDGLRPFERGQIAHVVSTADGARKFCETEPPVPSEWLCVFDPLCRFAKPGSAYRGAERGEYHDPFDLYGLDTDVVPEKIDPEDHYAKREIPATAWDAFAANRLDRQNLRHENFSALRGHWAMSSPRLPPRLDQLGEWIAKVAHQHATIWWAAIQVGIHPDILDRVLGLLDQPDNPASIVTRDAWHYLITARHAGKFDFHQDLYRLRTTVAKFGWTQAKARSFVEVMRPYLKAGRNYWGGPKPPSDDSTLRVQDLVNLDVEYPDQNEIVEIPDEWLEYIVAGVSDNLKLALVLESELGGYALDNISPIIPDDDGEASDSGYQRRHGLSGAVIFFAKIFARLARLNKSIALTELATWPIGDETIFARLRIWSAGLNNLVPAGRCASLICGLTDGVFWDQRHQRDLLIVVSGRWKDFSPNARKRIGEKLLQGPKQYEGEDDADYTERKAWASLSRITWMVQQGCAFSFDVDAETKRLRQLVVKWKEEYATNAARSLESRVGWVKTETDHSSLLNLPLNQIFVRAAEVSGKTEGRWIERDPFAGLVKAKPIRALAALRIAAQQGEYPDGAWRTFLNSEARKDDKVQLMRLLSNRLGQCSNVEIAKLAREIADWLLATKKKLINSYPLSFYKLLTKVVISVAENLSAGNSSIYRNKTEVDWATEALNSPIGKIAEALFNDQAIVGLNADEGLPNSWKTHVQSLLTLSGDPRRHALVIFAHKLNWFHFIDPVWTEHNVISLFQRHDGDADAVWAGFLWGAKMPHNALYKLLKPWLLDAAQSRKLEKRGHLDVLVAMILGGWGRNLEQGFEPLITNEEMRNLLVQVDDNFRSQLLWKLESWSRDKDDQSDAAWTDAPIEFLKNAWPLQKSVRTPIVSARLCELAFSNKERFPLLAELILPLLTTIDRDRITIRELNKEGSEIVASYPNQVLAILHAILPASVAAWPFGIAAAIRGIGEANPSLKLDERLIELERKWNAR